MDVVLSRVSSPVLSSMKREELRSHNRRLRRKMLFESLEDRSLLATLYWDPNGATAGVGGSGTWDNSSPSWTTDSTGVTGHVAWNNANNDTAVFGGTAGTVTINPATVPTINVGGLDFTVTGYTIATAAAKSLTFAANSNVSVASGSTANISGVISGTNGFNKIILGELVLSGTNTYAGATIVTSGNLTVNGTTAASSPVTVNTGGRLGGTGTVNGLVSTTGTGAIDAGLTGATAGTLLVNNALTLASTSTFSVQLGGTAAGDGVGFYDRVTASSSVVLGGATLDLSLNNFLPAVGNQFTIIDKTSAGTITGTFNGLPEGQQFVVSGTTFQISYVGGDGNDVVLTATAAAANAAPTALALSPTTIAENAGQNATVGTFTTTDPNSGDTFTYSLVSGTGSTDNALFNISGNTLRATNSLDFETQQAYSIRARTTDAGGQVFENIFTINATDVTEFGVTITPTTGLITTEAGGSATFTVVLNTQPTANVTIPLSSSDTTEGSVSPTSVTFTPANWNTSQTVTVTGADDVVVDGAVAYTVVTGAATSADLNYNGFNPADVSVTNSDNDSAGITVIPISGLTTTEAGGTATFTIVLNMQPTASVTIPLSSSDTTEGNVTPTSVTFTTANWNTPQTVTVTGVDDLITDGTIAYTVVTGAATSTDLAYSGLNAADVAVSNTDNEVVPSAGITVTPTTGLTTTEGGGTATFTIVLNTQPTASVTIPLSSSDATEGSVSPASVTFTTVNWNTPQTVTVTGVDDALVDGAIAYTVVTGTATSADLAYNGVNATDVSVSNTDNDAAGVTVTPTSGLTTTEAGGTATFTIVLNRLPTATVTIPLSSSDPTEGSVSPTSVTFTTANWNVPQTVTVTGADDVFVDGTIAYTVVTGPATSADLTYNTFNAADVTVSNTDNDVAPTAGVTVTPTSGLITTEAGGTATFTVVLNTQPTATVTIPLSSSDATEGSVSPTSVTFTVANWNTPQTVTVTGADDVLADGTVAYTVVTGPAASADLAYSGINAADVAVSNTDNDSAGVTVTPISGLTTTEAGGTATFTIVLNMQPTATVTIPLSSSDVTEGSVLPNSVTFTTANWNTPQTVTVTGVDDAIVDGTISYTVVTGPTASADLAYSGFNAADVAVSNTDNDVVTSAGVTVTPASGLITTEAGGTATFTVVLNSQPTANVTIPLTSSDATEGSVSPVSVTFTPGNWNVPQTVTVTGVNDAIVDGTIAYTVVTAPATSTDLAYSGFDASDVAVSNTDNDAAGITVTPTSGLTTTEAGGTATFTIVLNMQPTATVTIPLSSSDPTEGSVSPTSVTFTTVNWNLPQTVTVTGVDDVIADGTIAYTVVTGPATSTDLAYSGFDASDVAVSNTDNDAAGITVTPTSGLTTTEAGGTATFTIVLNMQPTASVTIPLSSSDTTEGTASPTSVTFTTANWNVPQTVTVTGVDDAIVDGTIAYTVVTGPAVSADLAYSTFNAADVSVSNTDNDVAAPAGVTVTPTSGLITTEAGGTATFTIVLNTQPTGTVTIPLMSNDTTEGTVSPASVTFTTANWNVPQTVTITGVDDALVDGTIAYSIVTGPATSTDPAYSAFNPADVGVSNTDNEAAGVTVTPTSGLTTTEAGGTATFTIVLNMQPTANVTIPLSSSDATEGSVAPTSVTFTTANWNVPQTVTVTGVDDAIVDGTIAYTVVTGAATSTDLAYSGFNAADVAVSNTDNEVGSPAGVTVTPTSGLTTTEGGGTATFTIVLNAQPTATVTIPLSSSDSTEGSVSPTSVTFTTVNWNVPQTVTVTGVDDAIADGTIAYTVVTGPATSADSGYNGFNAADVSVSNTDNEVAGTAGVTVSPTSGLTTTESGGVAVFTIVLNTQPTANVTIPLTSSDTTEGNVSPTSVTFTSANWNVPQLVTVTGVDDAIVDGNVAYTIITGAATSTDGSYTGFNAADVSLTNVDNEVAAPSGITVTPTSGLTTTEAGGTATFTIVLNSQPTANVTVPLSSSDLTEGTVSPTSVTFTTANWNIPQTVTVTGVDDVLVDGTIAYTVVTGAASSTDLAYSGFNAADVTVSNTDNDVSGPGSITVSPTSGLTTTEGGGIAVFTVVLNTQPTANVTIPLTSSDTTEGTVSPTSLTFTSANWNVPQSVTVTGADDAIVDGTIAYTIITGAATSTDSNYSGVNGADVALNNVDNEVGAPSGITVTPTAGLTTTESGGTATFTIVLNSQPTGSVTVPLTSSDLTEGTVSPASITFTTANWNIPQTVTVTGVEDAIVDGTIAYTVLTGSATSTDLAYSGFNAADVAVSNTDNDVAGPGSFTVVPTSGLTTTESGGIAVFTVVLNTQPTANVTIPLSSSDTTEGTVSPSSLTFTSANWNVPQSVTVTGADDAIIDGNIAYTINTGAATSSDANYSGVNPADVTLTNADNEVAVPSGITVTPTAGLTTTEAGGTATFTIVLNSQPTANVTIPLTTSDSTEGTVSPASITFTTTNWNVPQTVTVTGVDDVIVDGNVSYAVLTGAATSTDASYNGVNAADVSLTNTDNDSTANAPPTISDIGNQTANENTPVSNVPFTVNDAETAASNLTVTATSSNTTLFPAGSITFGGSGSNRTISLVPAANQSGTATITVTVADGAGGQDSDTFTVTVTGASMPTPTTPGTAQIVDDPENPGQRVLVINGTSNLDVISLWRSGSNRTLVLVPLSGINRTFDNSSFDRILINGFAGSDRIILDPFLNKPATINGDAGDDIILSGAAADVINGGTGTDFIWGRGGNDFIFGDNGRDYLYGEDGDDVIVGGDDNDLIWGGNGDDVLNGGSGFDYIYGFGGDDLIIGGNLSQENSMEGLQSIQAKWTANLPFDVRISSLEAEINSTTVTDDDEADWIFGNDGRDWMVDYALRDRLWDFNSSSTNGDRRN